ncbi:MAG: alanine dehydrogenase [Euryhalocaulis sp.]|uniref:alanine dehydrogenase n=1 Tax=Euryhalocaulis sp. TaxID=2744307 RepID=UPI0017A65B0A|nr:alanine dehydrogenase [Euryhalocaulis sp.]MBA4801085.1 alanine dehydrogenase [Euryhalocaulis sp.]
MRVGVPTEIKNNEFRVGLSPASVREYVGRGHEVTVQAGAGAGIGCDDAAYEAAGAFIAPDAAAVFKWAEMIVKVKEPQPEEWVQLREDQILYTYLHLAPDPKQTQGLLESGVSAVAYETVTDAAGGLPLLAPMSEVAGRLSIQAAAQALQKNNGGLGMLLGGVPGVLPAKVVVLGGGIVGLNAARMAMGLGADVTIMERSNARMRYIDDVFGGRIRTRYSTAQDVDEAIDEADAVIGAVLIPGASAPKLVTREMLKDMKPGSVVVDVAIDQGGCFETSHATTHADPTYVVEEVVHYCVANMPGAVPKTSTHALNNATLPYGLQLADQGLEAIKANPHLQDGLNTHKGKVTNMHVAESLNLDFVAPLDALGR